MLDAMMADPEFPLILSGCLVAISILIVRFTLNEIDYGTGRKRRPHDEGW